MENNLAKNFTPQIDIETKKLEDGTTVIKMGNNTYEFPLTVAAPVYSYKKAA